MKMHGVKSVMFAGTGEPLLHPKIDEIVDDAWFIGLDVAFTTNGVLLHKLETLDKCEWVKISMNAGTRESYAAIHQTNPKDWDSIWRHLPSVIARKGNCKVGIQCVVLPENFMDMAQLAARAKDAGVDYLVLKPYSQATFSLVQRSIDYRTMQDELNAVRDNFAAVGFNVIVRTNAITNEITGKHNFEKCRATPFTWVYLMADGRVFTCSAHLMSPEFCIGNINQQSFKDIWEGPERQRQWEQMKEFDIHNCRLSCRMAQVNTYLEQLDVGIPHANFI
jgi:radical SAM protein with 4Fe4S-binding SPASM domain